MGSVERHHRASYPRPHAGHTRTTVRDRRRCGRDRWPPHRRARDRVQAPPCGPLRLDTHSRRRSPQTSAQVGPLGRRRCSASGVIHSEPASNAETSPQVAIHLFDYAASHIYGSWHEHKTHSTGEGVPAWRSPANTATPRNCLPNADSPSTTSCTPAFDGSTANRMRPWQVSGRSGHHHGQPDGAPGRLRTPYATRPDSGSARRICCRPASTRTF